MSEIDVLDVFVALRLDTVKLAEDFNSFQPHGQRPSAGISAVCDSRESDTKYSKR